MRFLSKIAWSGSFMGFSDIHVYSGTRATFRKVFYQTGREPLFFLISSITLSSLRVFCFRLIFFLRFLFLLFPLVRGTTAFEGAEGAGLLSPVGCTWSIRADPHFILSSFILDYGAFLDLQWLAEIRINFEVPGLGCSFPAQLQYCCEGPAEKIVASGWS